MSMRTYFIAVALLIPINIFAGEEVEKEIKEKVDKRIVIIRTEMSCGGKAHPGTGFYAKYKSNIYLITAGHNIRVADHSTKSTTSDISIIATSYTGDTFELSTGASLGKEVIAIGYVIIDETKEEDIPEKCKLSKPVLDKPLSISDNSKGEFKLNKLSGSITGLSHSDYEFPGEVNIETSTGGFKGMSGGPLVDKNTGKVLGFVRGHCGGTEVFVPSKSIIKYLDKIRSEDKPEAKEKVKNE